MNKITYRGENKILSRLCTLVNDLIGPHILYEGTYYETDVTLSESITGYRYLVLQIQVATTSYHTFMIPAIQGVHYDSFEFNGDKASVEVYIGSETTVGITVDESGFTDYTILKIEGIR